jgi:hypothetical protein
MSLPNRQQHALDRIEARLLSGDPNLKSMFATFTRMNSLEAMPCTEAIRPRLPSAEAIRRRLPSAEVVRRRLPAVVLVCILALAMAGVIAMGALMSGPSCVRTPGRGAFAHPMPIAGCRAGAVAGHAGGG